MSTESDTLGRRGIDLIMQGQGKEGRALVLQATRLENEERREMYRRYMLQMAEQPASSQPENKPD